MKIRILGNSVRFRLTISEVAFLCQEGYVEDQTHFPDNTFTYAVKMVKGDKALHAEYDGQSVVLCLPQRLGNGWEENSVVGFEEKQAIPGGHLNLLLEKDFACLEKRAEDDQDTYPNPKANTD